MIKTLFSNVATLRCPSCEELQSVFAARNTWRGNSTMGALAPGLTCRNCASKLVCRSRVGAVGYWLARIALVMTAFVLLANTLGQFPFSVLFFLFVASLIAQALLDRTAFYLEEFN